MQFQSDKTITLLRYGNVKGKCYVVNGGVTLLKEKR